MSKKRKSEIINNKLPKEQREGQVGINKQGLEMKITRYSKLEGQKDKTIDVVFLIDGYKVENKTYRNFMEGYIRNPNFPNPRFIDRTGERRQNKQGDWMEVVECLGANNNIVKFDDDGSIVKGVSWKRFDKGGVEHPVRLTESLYYNYPEIAKAIAIEKNGITLEDTKHMKCGSDKKYFVKCPDCGKISNKKKLLNNLTRYGIGCQYCYDGTSIPNKILRQMDKQLNLDLQFEYSPEWLGRKSFDAYDDKLKIAIEMDAEYKDNHKGKRKEIDDWKDKQAIKHGIKVIRVN